MIKARQRKVRDDLGEVGSISGMSTTQPSHRRSVHATPKIRLHYSSVIPKIFVGFYRTPEKQTECDTVRAGGMRFLDVDIAAQDLTDEQPLSFLYRSLHMSLDSG